MDYDSGPHPCPRCSKNTRTKILALVHVVKAYLMYHLTRVDVTLKAKRMMERWRWNKRKATNTFKEGTSNPKGGSFKRKK